MKLAFNSITLGGGPNYYIDDNFRGLDGELENVIVNVPRTDYSKGIADFLKPKVRPFSGTIVGDDVDDLRDRKRDFVNMLRQEFTFTLTDDYINPDGTTTVYETYQFDGKIVEANANNILNSNSSKFELQIYSEDPRLYLTSVIDETVDIEISGFIFPLTFPFVFTGQNNTLTVVNNGNAIVHPTITITGAGTNFTITAEDSPLDNKDFLYSSTLASNEDLIINPIPTNPVKATVNGASVVGNTNNNFDALVLYPGSNTFTFLVESNLDENTSARFQAQAGAFIGI